MPNDPLAGCRNALNRGEVAVLTWPDSAECPIKTGYVEELRSCTITIGKTQRKLVKGVWQWEARVIREVPDTIRIPASQHGQAHPQQYVKTSAGAVDGIGEEVDEEYLNALAAEAAQANVLLSSQRSEEARRAYHAEREAKATQNGQAGTERFYARMKGRKVGTPESAQASKIRSSERAGAPMHPGGSSHVGGTP